MRCLGPDFVGTGNSDKTWKREFLKNRYDACVANREIENSQHTIQFHVDDLLSSHQGSNANNNFYDLAQKKYGSLKPVTIQCGKVHKFLGMVLDFQCLENIKCGKKST